MGEEKTMSVDYAYLQAIASFQSEFGKNVE
jgi:hypothetical protein